MATNIATYIKNLGKSVAFSTMDQIKEHTEATSSFVETNQELFTDLYTNIRDYKTTFKRIETSIRQSKIYAAAEVGIDATLDSIKTGAFYSKKREDYYTNKALGSMGDFGGDDFGDLGGDWSMDDGDLDGLADFGDWGDDDLDISDGDRYLAEETDKTAKVAAGAISETIAASAKYTAQSQRIGTNMLYSQSLLTNKTLASGFEQLHGSMQSIANAQLEAMKVADSNNQAFYTRKLELDKDRNEMLARILEIQQKVYNMEPKKEKEREDLSFSGIVDAMGMPDLKKYIRAVKKNLENEAGMLGSLGNMMGEDSNIFMTFAANPLQFIPNMIASYLIPKSVETAMQSFDKTVSGFFASAMAKLNAKKRDDDNPIAQMLGKIFGVKNSTKESLDSSRYEKGAVPFDGITRKSIVEVIPFYLRQIAAGVTGQPEVMYDYESGKFISAKSLTGKFKDLKNASVKSGTSEIREAVNKNIKDNKTRFQSVDEEKKFYEDMERIYTGIYNDGGYIDTKAKRFDLANRYGVSEHNMKLFLDSIWPNIQKSTRMGLAGSVMRARQSHMNNMLGIEAKGDSVYNQLFNDSKEFALEVYKDDGTVKADSKKSILLTVTDNKGRNVFYYLQETVRELMWQRQNWLAGGGSGGHIGGGNVSAATRHANARAARGAGLTDFNDTVIPVLQSEEQKRVANQKQREIDQFTRRAEELAQKYPNGIDMVELSGDEQRLYAEVKSKMAITNEVERRKQFSEGKFEKISAWYDKINPYGEGDAAKQQLEELQKMMDETDGFFNQLRKAKTIKDKFGVIKLSSSKAKNGFVDFVADSIGRADEALYKLIFGDDKEIDDEAPSFLDALTGQIQSSFERLNTWLDTQLDKLKGKLGIESFGDIPKKIAKDFFGIDLDEMWKNAGQRFQDFMKPLGDSIKETANAAFETVKDSLDSVADSIGLNELLENMAMSEEAKKRKEAEAEQQSLMEEMAREARESSVKIAREKRAESDKLIAQVISGEKDFDALKSLGLSKKDLGLLNSRVSEARDQLRVQKSEMYYDMFGQAEERYVSQIADEAENKYVNWFVDEVDKRDAETEKQRKELEANQLKWISRANAKSAANTKRVVAKRNAGDTPTNAKGTPYVEESGITAISKGEMIIPANLNPFNPDRFNVDIDAQERNEQRIIEAAKAGKIKKRAEGTGGIARDVDKPGFGSAMWTVTKGGLSSLKNGLFTDSGTRRDPKFERDLDKAKEEVSKYAYDMAGGGIVGGILGLLVGGPLFGAVAGAGINLARKSNVVQEALFGKAVETDKDGNVTKRDGSGIISDNIMKMLPDLKKFGITGAVLGTLTPLGPIGGLFAGSAIAYAKQNEEISKALFGESGDPNSGLFSQNRKKWIMDRLPHAAVGALGTALLGPFGIGGGLVVGAGLGLLSTTDEFKDRMFGVEVDDGQGGKVRKGGVVGMLRTSVVEPLKDLANDIRTRGLEWIKNDIIKPVADAIAPISTQLSLMVRGMFDFIGNSVNNIFMKVLGNPLEVFINDHIINPFKRVFGTLFNVLTKPAAWALSRPSAMIGALGNKLRDRQVRKGTATYMSAEENLAWMEKRGIKSEYEGRYQALNAMNSDQVSSMLDILDSVTAADPTLQLTSDVKDLSGTIVRSVSTDDFEKDFRTKDKDKIVKILKKAKLVNGEMDERSRRKLYAAIDSMETLNDSQKASHKKELEDNWIKMHEKMNLRSKAIMTKDEASRKLEEQFGVKLDLNDKNNVIDYRKQLKKEYDVKRLKEAEMQGPKPPQDESIDKAVKEMLSINTELKDALVKISQEGIKINTESVIDVAETVAEEVAEAEVKEIAKVEGASKVKYKVGSKVFDNEAEAKMHAEAYHKNLEVIGTPTHTETVSEAAGIKTDENGKTVVPSANGLISYDTDTKGDLYIENTPDNKEVLKKNEEDKEVQRGILSKLTGIGSGLSGFINNFFGRDADGKKKAEPWWKKLISGIGGMLPKIPLFAAAAYGISKLYTWVTGDNLFQTIVEGIKGAFGFVVDNLPQIADTVGGVVGKVLETLTGSDNLLDIAKDFITDEEGNIELIDNETGEAAGLGKFLDSATTFGALATYRGNLEKAVKTTVFSKTPVVGKLLTGTAKAIDKTPELAGKLVEGISSVFRFISKFIPAKANEAMQTFVKGISDELMKRATTGTAVKAAAKQVARIASRGVLLVTDFVAGFFSGQAEAGSIFGLIEGAYRTNSNGQPVGTIVEITPLMKIIAGLIRAVNNVITLGIIPESWIVNLALEVFNVVFGTDIAKIKEMQGISKDYVDSYNKANTTNYSVSEYSMDVQGNKSIFKKAGAALASGASSITNAIKGVFSPQNLQYAGVEQPMGTSGAGTASKAYKQYYQMDPRIANLPYQTAGDTRKQTIGDSGCGPVAGANLLSRITGVDMSVEDAAKFATSNGFKSINTGTDPSYFKALLNENNANAEYYKSGKDINRVLMEGRPVILMGKDVSKSNATPFGTHSHYVVATGIDKFGNIIIDDPEDRSASKKYNSNKVLSKTSLGVAGNMKTLGVSAKRTYRGIGGEADRDYKHQDLGVWTPVNAADLDGIIAAIRPDSGFIGCGRYFVDAARQSNLDPRYLVAHACWETGWGTSQIFKKKRNCFGISAYDSSPFKSAYSYASTKDGIIKGALWIKEHYYDQGYKTLAQMNTKYATDPNWQYGIASIMRSINNRLENGDFVTDMTIIPSENATADSATTSDTGFWSQFVGHLGNIGKALYGDIFSDIFGGTLGNMDNATTQYGRIAASDPYGSADTFFTQTLNGSKTSLYNEKRTRKDGSTYYHGGIDYGAAGGTPIYTPVDGEVVTNAYEEGGYGNYVVVKDANGNKHYFAHMNVKSSVKVGDKVKRGDQVGTVGTTGSSSGNHLHYEIRQMDTRINKGRIDPNAYFAEQGLGKNTNVTNAPLLDPNKVPVDKSGRAVGSGKDNEEILIKLVTAIIEILGTIAGNTDKLSQIVELLTQVTGAKIDTATLKSSQDNSKAVAQSLLKALGTPTNGTQIIDKENDDRLTAMSKYLVDSMTAIAAS